MMDVHDRWRTLGDAPHRNEVINSNQDIIVQIMRFPEVSLTLYSMFELLFQKNLCFGRSYPNQTPSCVKDVRFASRPYSTDLAGSCEVFQGRVRIQLQRTSSAQSCYQGSTYSPKRISQHRWSLGRLANLHNQSLVSPWFPSVREAS